uniref:Protein PHLOEM PROTEIN 2-LIKE A10 n=1 Tax=Noccaea caerulescens TaxID=107243 RepID=A0A1J3FXS9_NOCCA
MDLARLGSISHQRRRKWLILLAFSAVSGYGAYKVYNSPYIARKTKRLTKLFGGIVSLAELVIDSAETISIVSRDLKEFLESDSDEIPISLKQMAKITKSKEFTDSLARVSEAVSIGVFRGYQESRNSELVVESGTGIGSKSRFLLSESGTGFVSVVVGSFAKNLVLGFYSDETVSDSSETTRRKPRWMSLLGDDKCRELLADCIERFTSSAVSVYIERTVGINTYDQIFSGLTNPKHRDSARDVLVSVCNGALETFIRTSHDVFTFKEEEGEEEEEERERRKKSDSSGNGWAEALTTTLAVPSNRKFMFDVTARVTLETMRSIVEFVILKTSQSFRRSFDLVHEEVTERGRQVVGYVGAKSSVIITVCLAVYLHVVNRCIRGSPVSFNQLF